MVISVGFKREAAPKRFRSAKGGETNAHFFCVRWTFDGPTNNVERERGREGEEEEASSPVLNGLEVGNRVARAHPRQPPHIRVKKVDFNPPRI